MAPVTRIEKQDWIDIVKRTKKQCIDAAEYSDVFYVQVRCTILLRRRYVVNNGGVTSAIIWG